MLRKTKKCGAHALYETEKLLILRTRAPSCATFHCAATRVASSFPPTTCLPSLVNRVKTKILFIPLSVARKEFLFARALKTLCCSRERIFHSARRLGLSQKCRPCPWDFTPRAPTAGRSRSGGCSGCCRSNANCIAANYTCHE